MNSQEFYLWLNGYLEALESEDIRDKMATIKNSNQQERVIFGPNINQPQQSSYAKPQTPIARK